MLAGGPFPSHRRGVPRGVEGLEQPRGLYKSSWPALVHCPQNEQFQIAYHITQGFVERTTHGYSVAKIARGNALGASGRWHK